MKSLKADPLTKTGEVSSRMALPGTAEMRVVLLLLASAYRYGAYPWEE